MAKEGLEFLHWEYFNLQENEEKERIIKNALV